MINETTALGAAFLAGLATGYWRNKEELVRTYQVDKTFVPSISDEKKEELYRGWKMAVKAARMFK